MLSKLGIIGGGIMAEAILSRLFSEKIYLPETVLVSEPQAERRDFWQREYGVRVTTDNREAVKAEIVLLAIKPQIFDLVTSQLDEVPPGLVISILAGVPLKKLAEVFPRVIRAMPNTPATVGAGMTALSAASEITTEEKEQAKTIFAAVGAVVEVPEYMMDAVTGLSGSGPAFVAMAIEALADGGVAAGLPRAIAQQLALQTVLGTAQLLQSTKLHPAELKDKVTSPGGTTIAGIAELEKAGFRSALIQAVVAASERSQQLGG